jgi:hypothetical protein
MRNRRALAAAAVLALAVTACGNSADSGSGASDGSAMKDRAGPPQQQQQKQKQGGDKAGLTQVGTLGRATIRTSSMTVRVADPYAAARDAVRLAESTGGYLESEQSGDDRTSVTLRVPPEDFTKTADALARLGTVTERQVQTEDVTTDVADVEGRLKAQRASTARVRALLGRATSISEITTLEAELNEREADLESLESRRRALAGQTSYASLTATFAKPVLAAAAPDDGKAPDGFGDGLRAGWRVFRETVLVLLVVLGALLPFAAAAGLVLGPVYVVRKRRRVSAQA